MKTLSLFAAILVIGVVPLAAFAHGDAPSFETEVDGYLIDIGYSSETPTEEEAVLFDFALESVSSETSIPFSDVWVKIEDETGAVVFASGIHNAEFGGSRMSYRFPGPGTYTVSARFENESDSIVEGSFPLTVSGATSGGENYLFGIAGLLLGGVLSFVALRRKGV